MAEISSDAQAFLKTVSPEAAAYATSNAPGGTLTSGEARRLTSAFLSSNANAGSQVYSAGNIAQTTTAPAPTPNLSDPFGIYDFYMNTPDLVSAREAAKTAQAQLLERTKAAREQQTALGQNLQSTNRIRGSQANAQELATNDIQALNEAYTLAASNVDALTSTAKDKMAIAEQQRNDIKQLIAATGGKAGISYTDTYESAVAKAAKYQEKVTKEEAKSKEKADLKSMALQLGIKTKGKSSKEIRSALEKAAKKDKDIKDKLQQLELASKQKSLNGSGSSGGSKELTALATEFAKNGGDWEKTATNLANQGFDVSAGSSIDTELRRRFGLAPIDKSVTATDLNSTINQKISQIEDWDTANDDEKRAYIRSLGGNPTNFGL